MRTKIIEPRGNILMKSAFLLIIIMVGVASGVYIGYSFIGQQQPLPITPNAITSSEVYKGDPLTLLVGERFPNESYIDLEGHARKFDQLISGQKSLIIFAYPNCNPCEEFFELWNSVVQPKLRNDVQVVICIPSVAEDLAIKEKEFSPNAKIVRIDEQLFYEKYNLNHYPTVLGVDDKGKIIHIQYRYTRYIDFEIFKYFTTHKV